MNKKTKVKLLKNLLKEIAAGHVNDDLLLVFLPSIKKKKEISGDFVVDKTIFKFDVTFDDNIIQLLREWFFYNIQNRSASDIVMKESDKEVSYHYTIHNNHLDEPDYSVYLEAILENGVTRLKILFELMFYDIRGELEC